MGVSSRVTTPPPFSGLNKLSSIFLVSENRLESELTSIWLKRFHRTNRGFEFGSAFVRTRIATALPRDDSFVADLPEAQEHSLMLQGCDPACRRGYWIQIAAEQIAAKPAAVQALGQWPAELGSRILTSVSVGLFILRVKERRWRAQFLLEFSHPYNEAVDGCAPVAQLDRAIDFESIGREFEPLRARQKSLRPLNLCG